MLNLVLDHSKCGIYLLAALNQKLSLAGGLDSLEGHKFQICNSNDNNNYYLLNVYCIKYHDRHLTF